MKLEALDHPKTLDLASRLDVELPTAIGYLELLWAFTGKKAPQGNIGKWPDGAIARACYWMGTPSIFIEALRASGFVDHHGEHRIVVHDWQEHAPRWVKLKLQNLELSFIEATGPTCEHPVTPPIEPPITAPIESPPKGSEEKPREGKPGERASAPDTRATRLPDDFTLSQERRQMAETEGVDPLRTFASFCDYWRSKGGSAARKTDWDATWRIWCRKEADMKPARRSATLSERITWRPTE